MPTIAEDLMAKGRIQGEQIGIQAGIIQGKIEMARNLLLKGTSPNVVKDAADLPDEEINVLINELKTDDHFC